MYPPLVRVYVTNYKPALTSVECDRIATRGTYGGCLSHLRRGVSDRPRRVTRRRFAFSLAHLVFVVLHLALVLLGAFDRVVGRGAGTERRVPVGRSSAARRGRRRHEFAHVVEELLDLSSMGSVFDDPAIHGVKLGRLNS